MCYRKLWNGQRNINFVIHISRECKCRIWQKQVWYLKKKPKIGRRSWESEVSRGAVSQTVVWMFNKVPLCAFRTTSVPSQASSPLPRLMLSLSSSSVGYNYGFLSFLHLHYLAYYFLELWSVLKWVWLLDWIHWFYALALFVSLKEQLLLSLRRNQSWWGDPNRATFLWSSMVDKMHSNPHIRTGQLNPQVQMFVRRGWMRETKSGRNSSRLHADRSSSTSVYVCSWWPISTHVDNIM